MFAGGPGGVQVVIQQTAGGGFAGGGVVGGGQGAGVLAEQVMQPVAAAGGLGDQVLAVQALKAAAGSGEGRVIERSGGAGIDIGAGVQAQPAEQPLLISRQVLIGQVEC